MTTSHVIQQCNRLPARAERVIHVASMLFEDHYPEFFHYRFFDDLDYPAVPGSVLAEMPELKGAQDPADVVAHLLDSERLGFLVQVSTPIKTYTSPTSTSYNWGRTTSAWFYGDQVELALEKAFLWIEERDVKARIEYLENYRKK